MECGATVPGIGMGQEVPPPQRGALGCSRALAGGAKEGSVGVTAYLLISTKQLTASNQY